MVVIIARIPIAKLHMLVYRHSHNQFDGPTCHALKKIGTINAISASKVSFSTLDYVVEYAQSFRGHQNVRIELIIRTYMRPVCHCCDMHIFSERCLQTRHAASGAHRTRLLHAFLTGAIPLTRSHTRQRARDYPYKLYSVPRFFTRKQLMKIILSYIANHR